ncbi:MAG: hypothetical protein JXA30_12985 [Deltaproteobacteria bacterium]|nr:hypothetical protein [Deltaproteobacteria bacterium]
MSKLSVYRFHLFEKLEFLAGGKAMQGIQRLICWLLLVVSFGYFVWEMRTPFPQIDDAFISYRYARNLVEGNGLVFNSGEYVEGYTNLFWTLLIAGGLALGIEAETAAHLLGLFCGLGALYFTFILTRTALPRVLSWLAGFAPVLLLSSASFTCWSSSGMETALFVAATTSAFVAYAGNRVGLLVLALSLATMTRPDGILVAFVLFAFLILQERGRLRRALAALAVFAAVPLGLTLYRIIYYHSVLPNTFYAKVGGIPLVAGLNYILGFLLSGWAILLVPAFYALRYRKSSWPEACYFLVLLLYVFAVGGDSFAEWRFLLPATPCLISLAIRGWAEVWRRDRAVGVALAAAFPAIFFWQVFGSLARPWLLALALIAPLGYLAWIALKRGQPRFGALSTLAIAVSLIAFLPLRAFPLDFYGCPLPVHTPTRWEKIESARSFNRAMSELARFLIGEIEADKPSKVLVASMSVGMFGYYSRYPIIDLVGITDPVIARSEADIKSHSQFLLPGHQRTNADYVLSRRPTHILLGDSSGAAIPAIWQIAHHPLLKRFYRYDERIKGYKLRVDAKKKRSRRKSRSVF